MSICGEWALKEGPQRVKAPRRTPGILHLMVVSHAGNHLFLLTIVSLAPLFLEWLIHTHCYKISPALTFAVVNHEFDEK